MFKVDLKPILAVLKASNDKEGESTYVPDNLAVGPLKLAFPAHSEKGLKPSCVERPLEVHVLDVEVEILAPFDPFDGKVEPSPEANERSIRN